MTKARILGSGRVNWTLDTKAITLVQKAAKHNGHSISAIVSELILQKLGDPIKEMQEARTYHCKLVNELDEKIAWLEELRAKRESKEK